jgi:hypothetical protein
MLHKEQSYSTPVCMGGLTLVCCALEAMLLLHSQLLLAVALQRAQGQVGPRRLLRPRQELRVVYSAMRAIGGEDGLAHVSADLCSAERARSACSLLVLQRAHCPVPLLEPALHGSLASDHAVARSESGEAVGARAWLVREENRVLGIGTELRHAAGERGAAVDGVRQRPSR